MKYSKLTRVLALLLALLLLGMTAAYAAEPGEDELPVIPVALEDHDHDEGGQHETQPAIPVALEDTEAPEETESPLQTMSDEELIAKYSIPNNWARPALLFVVRAGLMKGRGDGTLSPKEPTTRAEVATMLIRILKITRAVSIAAYSDVKPDAWYYNYLRGGGRPVQRRRRQDDAQ